MERRDIIARTLGLFPPGKCIDLGTGHGGYARLAAALGWSVTAVDARTERWPRDRGGIEWMRADVRDVDLDPYDLVLCLGLFYHLTVDDQLELLRRVQRPMIIDTEIDHGPSRHKLSEQIVTIHGYQGRLYDEPGKTTSSWGNDQSFWPTLRSLQQMLHDCGFPLVLTADPWVGDHRAVFVALP